MNPLDSDINSDTKLRRTTLRVREDLYSHLEAAAKYNGRSLNAEIIARLEAASLEEQFTKILRELADLKALNKEILDSIGDRRP